jgi:general secretion pathway protein K
MPADIGRTNALRDEAGSITILALWSIAIIAFLLAAATATTRTELRTTQNALAESQARLAAVAGTQLGVGRLLRRRATGTRVFDGTPEMWRDGAIPVEIAIIDEAGKIDPNMAPAELLSGLLVAVGRPRDEADRLACNILAWRGGVILGCGEDGTRRPSRRFAMPEQLAQVTGFDERLYDAVADYVTVATHATKIDPLVAARPVLLAIPGAEPTTVDTFLESRAQWHDAGVADSGLGALHAVDFVTTSPAEEFTIRAIAAAGSARYRADLLVRLGDKPQSFQVLAARVPPVDRGRAVVPPARRAP